MKEQNKIRLLTMAEYAAHRDIAKQTVTYAVKSGKLSKSVKKSVTGKTLIDPDIADQEWSIRAPNKSSDKADEFKQDKRFKELDLEGNIPMLAESRAKREAYEAEMARIKFEKEQGRVIDVDQVRDMAFKAARSVRDGMLNIPDRIAGELAHETNQFKIHTRLLEEIRRCLEHLDYGE